MYKPERRNLNKRISILILKLAVTVSAVVYLVVSDKLRFSNLLVREGGWPWLGLAGAAILLWIALCQVRHWLLLRSAGVVLSPGKVLRAGFIAWFFNTSLFGGLGFMSADAIKVGYLLKDREGGTSEEIVGATLVDRFLGIVGLLLLAVLALQVSWSVDLASPELRLVAEVIYAIVACVGLSVLVAAVALARNRRDAVLVWLVIGGGVSWGFSMMWGGGVLPLIILGVPLVVGVLAPFLAGDGAVHRALGKSRIGKRVSELILALLRYRNRLGTVAAAIGLSIGIHLFSLVALYGVGRGISIEQAPTLSQVCVAGPPATAMSVLPLPANGLGVGEAAFDGMLRFCLGPDGSPLEGGATIYLSFRIVITALAMTGLFFYWVGPGRDSPKRGLP